MPCHDTGEPTPYFYTRFVDSMAAARHPGTAPHPLPLSARTIGEAWIAIATRILVSGAAGVYEGQPMHEILLATLRIEDPKSVDDLIERHADKERLAWMHANFTELRPVSELGDADSYATRLRDYASSGRDQLRWVICKLRDDPTSRSATITTFQPLSDTSYIPCVSMLDFFLTEGSLQLVVYAHSIDFGTKGYGNLVELALLQEEVSRHLEVRVGALTVFVKSAHVYISDVPRMSEVLKAQSDA